MQVAAASVAGPRLEPLAGGFQHPTADRQDEAGFLGEWDELARRDQSAFGMRPAQQRLGADPFAVAIDLRLIVQHETALANGDAKRRLRFGADGERRLHVGIEEAQRVAPRRLRFVHGDVGLLEQLLASVAAAAEHGDADAGAGMADAAGQRIGRVERGENRLAGLLGQRRGFMPVFAQVLDQRHELVAAHARRAAGRAETGFEAPRDLDQQLVADFVAARLVDQLEIVEIDEQQRPVAAAAAAAGERLLEAVAEQAAVRQTGQPIVKGEVDDLLFGALAIG